MYFTLQGH